MDKIQIIEKLFSYILEYSYLLIAAFFFFSKNKRSTIVIALLVYGLVFFFFLHYYYDIPKSYRKLSQTVYTFLEYSFFAYFAWLLISSKRYKKLILILSVLFLIFQVYYYLTSKPQRIDSIPVGIETILVLVYIFIYFRQFFASNNTDYIYNDPSFWIIVGILIYLCSSFFFNILANYVPRDNWHLTFIPEIIKNILFGFSIVTYKPLLKSKHKAESNFPFLDMI